MDNFIPLDSIHVATPCTAEWNAMPGDSRTRFCATCAKNVYNLSDMSRAEAEALVNEREGKMCAVFFRRADGTVLTDDCPVALRPVRNGALHTWRLVTAVAIAVGTVCGGWLARAGDAAPKRPAPTHRGSPARTLRRLGRIAAPRPQTPPVPGGIGIAPRPTPTPAPKVVHPGTAPGVKVLGQGAAGAKVIQVPVAEPIGPGGLMGAPAPPAPLCPAPPAAPQQVLGDIALPAPELLPDPTPTPAPTATPGSDTGE